MRKRDKRRRWIKRRVRRPREPTEPQVSWRTLESPFQGLTDAEVLSRLKGIGDSVAADASEALRSLEERLLTLDPFVVLASLVVHTGGRARKPSEMESESPPLYVFELVQALILRHPPHEFKGNPPFPGDLADVEELALRAGSGPVFADLAELDSSMDEQERTSRHVIALTRGHTIAIRGWGYPERVIRIVRDIVAPLDTEVEQQIGVSISSILDVCLALQEITLKRLKQHHDKLRPLLQASVLDDAVEGYYTAFALPGGPDDFVQSAKRHAWDIDTVKSMLISHSNVVLPGVFTFSLDDIDRASGESLDVAAVAEVLERLSVALGELADVDPGKLLLDNPIWTRPLVRQSKDLFFWPVMWLLPAFCTNIVEYLLAPHANLLQRYFKRRSSYLENRLESLFRSAFPMGISIPNVKWLDDVSGEERETDLLVVVDTHALILEAKSGKVHPSARRGGSKRLKRSIKDLIEEPAKQSKRFEEWLQSEPGVQNLETVGERKCSVDTSQLTHFTRLSVTLELFAGLDMPLPDLRAAGLITAEVPLPLTLTLADLEIIVDVLDSPCRLLHYLSRRSAFADRSQVVADQMEALGSYCKTRMVPEEAAPGENQHMFLTGFQGILDDYYMQGPGGQPVSKPCLRMTDWWSQIIQRLEARRPHGWADVGCMLLELPYEAQMEFEAKFQKMQRDVLERGPREHAGRVWFAMKELALRNSVAIIGVAYRGLGLDRRNRVLDDAISDTLASTGASSAVVIGIDVANDLGTLPYTVLALDFAREDDDPKPPT